MRVFRLQKSPNEYSCNVYYILGDWNTIPDVNTLIDVGPSDFIIPELESFNSGVGKRKVDQVIITHDHFDHSAALKIIVPLYKPKVYGHSPNLTNDQPFYDGMELRIGDRTGILLHTPGHSKILYLFMCLLKELCFRVIQCLQSTLKVAHIQLILLIPFKGLLN